MVDRRNADVLIVGSGPVGATYARLLGASGGRRITMVDSGPHLSDRPGRHLANAYTYQQHPNLFLSVILSQLEVFSVPPNARRSIPGAFVPPLGPLNFENPEQDPAKNMPFASASYAVGGMGTHWTCCTPDPAPMERTPLVPDDDWDLMLRIARKLLNVHTDAFSPSVSNAVVAALLRERGFEFTDLPMAAERRPDQQPDHAHMVTWTGTDTVLGPLLDGAADVTSRLTIWPECRLEQLITDDRRITGARFLDLTTHQPFTIEAAIVIVAAGPLLTPQVLWRSGIRPPALGRYLNANHTVSACIAFNPEVVERLRTHPHSRPKPGDPVPLAWDDPPVMLGRSPSDTQPWRVQIQRRGHYLSHDLLEHVGVPEPLTDARLELELIWFGMVQPREENRIEFSDTRSDRFGQPQMTIHYAIEKKEIDAIERQMLQEMTDVATALGGFLPHRPPKAETAGSTLHYHGTCRMGEDPGTSVVNPFSLVWGFDNLYLGSVGVIPNAMATNPTLTACALAVRAAAKICGRSLYELAVEIGATAGIEGTVVPSASAASTSS